MKPGDLCNTYDDEYCEIKLMISCTHAAFGLKNIIEHDSQCLKSKLCILLEETSNGYQVLLDGRVCYRMLEELELA